MMESNNLLRGQGTQKSRNSFKQDEILCPKNQTAIKSLTSFPPLVCYVSPLLDKESSTIKQNPLEILKKKNPTILRGIKIK